MISSEEPARKRARSAQPVLVLGCGTVAVALFRRSRGISVRTLPTGDELFTVRGEDIALYCIHS